MKAVMRRLMDGETNIEVPEGSVGKSDVIKLVRAVKSNTTLKELR